jgi:hypothetical protein
MPNQHNGLRSRRDYGEQGHRPQDYSDEEILEMSKRLAETVNPYLNTPPTKIKRDLKNEKDKSKRKKMTEALNAWRTTVPGPFSRTQVARELLTIAKTLLRR